MSKNFKYLYIFLLFFSISKIEGQEAKLDKAEKIYEKYGYIDALEIYLKVAQKGFESEELFQRLGNSYYFNAEYSKALKWYKKLFDINQDQSEQYLRRYAQSLQAIGDLKEAKNIYNLSKDKEQLSAEDYLDLIDQNSGRYAIKAFNIINTSGREFGHSLQDGKLIYASTRDTGVFIKRRNSWDGLSFLDLYEVKVKENTAVGKPEKLNGDVNGKYHEASAVLTANGESLYFTRSDKDNDRKNDQYLRIYRAQLIEGKWKNLEDLSINVDGYSTAHPSLDKEEKYLYFSSNRPGGYGESDIYRAAINEDGSLTEPENLGSKINTKGKETFPFVSDKNELYFSSDGHFGLGGLDVFYVKINDSGFGNILNVGQPVNSYADDFSFGINIKTKRGYFSSNRAKDKGFKNDNIYTFRERERIKDLYSATIYGKVIDRENNEPIANAILELFEGEDPYGTVKTDKQGNYRMEVNFFKLYSIRASKENYDKEEAFSTRLKQQQKIDFKLNRNSLALTPGTDISGLLNIKHILFDFDKSNIRSDARVELEKLLTVMEKYPDLKIEIRSHTDSRGTDTYNKSLSQRRAQSTLRYLVEEGIEENRLRAKGYGEEQLVNECINGVPCSKAQHQENRRSEFIIVDPKE